MEKNWRGLPYFGISEFYQDRFGEKVYKIPVSIAESCPNREGLKGMETCIFCDAWGSSANEKSFQMTLKEQIEGFSQKINKKYKAQQFLVYFQAYTNSFLRLRLLQEAFQTSLEYDFVKGFVLGTRPDCLSKAVLDLWETIHQKSFMAIELGVQSFFDDQLEFLKRGHSAQQSIDAISRIKEHTHVDLGIHLIFGLPNETDDHILETASIVNKLPITNVKLHHLHVLRNTGLEKLYLENQFVPISRQEYARKVQLFLQHISPSIYIHRLAAYSSRWDELVAPPWTNDKMGTHQFMIDHLRSSGAYQAQNYHPLDAQQTAQKELLKQRSLPIL